MLYKEDWELTRKRLIAFWDKEIVDRCCASIVVPKESYKSPVIPKDEDALFEYYLNPQVVLKRARYKFENHSYLGDALPTIMPFVGTAGHAAYFDIKYKFADDTIWFFPIIDDYEKDKLVFNPDNNLYKLQKELMTELAKQGKDEFFVSMPDNCGSMDALCQLRDSEKLLMDMYEHPDEIMKNLDIILDVLTKTNDELFEIIKDNNYGGSVHEWMHTYHPGRHSQLQADLSCMISRDCYEQYVLPELIYSTERLDASIYHLDGMEQLRHLDLICSVPELKAIQWTSVAGQPKPSEFIEAFQTIQKSGKNLIIMPHYTEVELIMENLSSKGLNLCIQGIENEEMGREMLKNVEKWTRE